ncbi:hypothetical protein O181_038698 [Austropuccinia psidii MF-1]|uniref:CBM21 domain-containing protein n=1 Tax=Austropuccinia psidii MF-1 TaxID=1389203 RepID=A0A9Q3HB90_9BASI|nr:hypothetical protein [Austropuccinia psidii MF-1]
MTSISSSMTLLLEPNNHHPINHNLNPNSNLNTTTSNTNTSIPTNSNSINNNPFLNYYSIERQLKSHDHQNQIGMNFNHNKIKSLSSPSFSPSSYESSLSSKSSITSSSNKSSSFNLNFNETLQNQTNPIKLVHHQHPNHNNTPSNHHHIRSFSQTHPSTSNQILIHPPTPINHPNPIHSSSKSNHSSPFHFNSISSHSSASQSLNLVNPNNSITTTRPLHQKACSETSLNNIKLTHHDHPKMLRKKSGEPLRSSLKLSNSSITSPSSLSSNQSLSSQQQQQQQQKIFDQSITSKSAPSTPLINSKVVHFDSHLEHVRHFLAQQRPIAVSRDGSPIETETEGEDEFPFPIIKSSTPTPIHQSTFTPTSTPTINSSNSHHLILELPNMPKLKCPLNQIQPVCLQSIQLTDDNKNLKGIIQVINLSFQKLVAVRFTFDNWETVSEVTAEYLKSQSNQESPSSNHNGIDLFGFNIKLVDLLATIQQKTLEIAIRYLTTGQEFWDNNLGNNYQVKFKSIPSNHNHHRTHQILHHHPPSLNHSIHKPLHNHNHTINFNKHSTHHPPLWPVNLKAELDKLIGDDLGLSLLSMKKPQKKLFNEKPKSNSLDALSAINQLKAGTGLSARYDFGLSLKQASSRNVESLPIPIPISPVPSDWVGMPAKSFEKPNQKSWSATNIVQPSLPPSPPQESSQNPSNHHHLISSQDDLNHFSGLVTPRSPSGSDQSN